MTQPQVSPIVQRLLGPAEPEIGCDTCFDELDHYVDLQLHGHDADAIIPGMLAHLAGCPACQEDHLSLHTLAHDTTNEPREQDA
jgi:hypothetical protein